MTAAEDISGIVLLDKEAGISSAQAIARVKRRLNLAKIGHAGTLDPFATGLLVCLVGGATRCARFAEEGKKRYRGMITLGVRTSTDDTTGEVLERSDKIPPAPEVKAAISSFRGEISQVPPQISAVKVNGERSYLRARRGETVALTARSVQVYSLEIEQRSATEYEIVMECSAGTYVRSIARDLGDKLGCGGALSALRREFSFPFDIRDAKKEQELTLGDVRSWEELFPRTPRVVLPSRDARRISSGDQSVIAELATRQEFLALVRERPHALYSDAESRHPLGILEQREGRWVVGLNFSSHH